MIKLYKNYHPLPIEKAPDDCLTVSLPLPYRRGNYRFKFKKIGEPTGANTITVMAYTRLVRVEDCEGYNHFRSIPVAPYKRRIKVYYFNKAISE